MCENLQKLELFYTSKQIIHEIIVILKNYTADKNFTRPPVATVATNSKSVEHLRCQKLCSYIFQVDVEGDFLVAVLILPALPTVAKILRRGELCPR